MEANSKESVLGLSKVLVVKWVSDMDFSVFNGQDDWNISWKVQNYEDQAINIRSMYGKSQFVSKVKALGW